VRSALTFAAEGALELWMKEGDLSAELVQIQSLADTVGVATQRVPAKTLVRLTEGAVHQGVVLRRRMPRGVAFEDYVERLTAPAAAPLLLVLDQVQDPQNFGACLRVADGAGADAILIPRDHSAQITGTVAKAASGALDSVPIIAVANLARALDTLRAAGMWLVGAIHDAPETIYDCDLSGPLGLVVGSEAKGLRQLTRAKCDRLARIPMGGAIASLNVSTAAAITLFEANRQRSRSGHQHESS
jgi:23S rRNA (guanosine2251-2'-O)-methyltransferase